MLTKQEIQSFQLRTDRACLPWKGAVVCFERRNACMEGCFKMTGGLIEFLRHLMMLNSFSTFRNNNNFRGYAFCSLHPWVVKMLFWGTFFKESGEMLSRIIIINVDRTVSIRKIIKSNRNRVGYRATWDTMDWKESYYLLLHFQGSKINCPIHS